MLWGTIFYDMLAGLGCASLTLVIFVASVLVIGARLGWFPVVNRFIERSKSGSGITLSDVCGDDSEKGGKA